MSYTIDPRYQVFVLGSNGWAWQGANRERAVKAADKTRRQCQATAWVVDTETGSVIYQTD